MEKLPKVLLVEDDRDIHEMWHMMLTEEVVFVDAYSVEEAERLFAESSGLSAVVVDACVPGNRPTTESLVRSIRSRFSGPIIGVSQRVEYRELLVGAGCQYQCDKEFLPEVLRTILAL
jgi:DNA-binding response OmpR family regulator